MTTLQLPQNEINTLLEILYISYYSMDNISNLHNLKSHLELSDYSLLEEWDHMISSNLKRESYSFSLSSVTGLSINIYLNPLTSENEFSKKQIYQLTEISFNRYLPVQFRLPHTELEDKLNLMPIHNNHLELNNYKSTSYQSVASPDIYSIIFSYYPNTPPKSPWIANLTVETQFSKANSVENLFTDDEDFISLVIQLEMNSIFNK